MKFKDADLIGIPLRVVVGERGLKDGTVEIKWREPGRGQADPGGLGGRGDPRRDRRGPRSGTTRYCHERRQARAAARGS